MRPAIAVFVESTSPYEYARTFREPHRRMLVGQLVPLVDGRFPTRAGATQRILLGADEAGFASVETALLFPDVFGVVTAQSIYPLSSGNAELVALIDRSSGRNQRFHLDWGRYDPRRAADLLDVPGFTREVRDRLAAKGHTVTGREWPDGSDVRIWSERALRALQTLLPLESR